MREGNSDEFCRCQVCLGKYTLLGDEENPRLAMFERRLPFFGCGVGWCCFLLGFLCPLIWYIAALLYCCKYYNRDPRERPGLCASAFLVSLISCGTDATRLARGLCVARRTPSQSPHQSPLHPSKLYGFDSSRGFTAAFRADVSEPPPKLTSPEEILAALNAIPGLEEDDLLAAYDILVSDDRKFKSLQALPEVVKRKWIMKQVKP